MTAATPVSLAGRVALVTGGSRGIGRAIAVALACDGADVAVIYRTREREATETRSAIEALDRRCTAVQADVSQSRDVARMVDTVHRELGHIGITRPQPLAEITEQDWNELIAANLTSAFLVTQQVLPDMRALGWGRIVNLSSVAAQLGGVVGPHYAASKAGLLGLTHAYAALLAGDGITANAIAPALIATEMVATNPRARPDLIPLGRFGTADEVAEAAVMLARNGYVTGQTISVNGGWYMT
jgi:3-oxoacyl-[acyl-carrier protein] reductase